MSAHLERNPGLPLDLDWVNKSRVNLPRREKTSRHVKNTPLDQEAMAGSLASSSSNLHRSDHSVRRWYGDKRGETLFQGTEPGKRGLAWEYGYERQGDHLWGCLCLLVSCRGRRRNTQTPRLEDSGCFGGCGISSWWVVYLYGRGDSGERNSFCLETCQHSLPCLCVDVFVAEGVG